MFWSYISLTVTKTQIPKNRRRELPTSRTYTTCCVCHLRLYKYDLTSFVRSVLYPTSLPSLSLPMTQQLANRVNTVSLGSLEPRISVSLFPLWIRSRYLTKESINPIFFVQYFKLKTKGNASNIPLNWFKVAMVIDKITIPIFCNC